MSDVQLTGRQLQEFASMARDMTKPADLDHTLDVVLSAARQAFLCDAVGILLVKDGKVTTAAVTDPAVQRADDLQTECDEGPCLEAIADRRDFVSDDLRVDARWRCWGPQAAELGFRSILSIGLVGGDRPFGALNLYSRQIGYFSPDDLSIGGVFSAQAAMALAGARERDSLLKAVEARHVIGQAQGILMERYRIDADQAFTVLRRYSSHLNRKLRLVADDVVHHRHLPDG